MIALEDGRAKELRQRFATTFVDEETMKFVPEALKEAYYSAAEALARSPLLASDVDAPAARTLNTVVDAIRSIPGHRGFATGTRASELTGAVEHGWPLIYVNPTVFGTLLLLVRRVKGEVAEGQEELRYSCRFIEGLPNGQITKTLLIGQKRKDHESDFYLSIFNDRNDATFPETLGNALAWVGNRLAKNIHEFVMDCSDEVDKEPFPVGITLVPCGHISLIPLDAATWIDRRTQERRCLADEFFVRYAPSGIIAAASIRKAKAFDNSSSPRVPHFLAIGDPLLGLSSARFEIEGISHHFPADSRHIAYEDAATLPFITTHAPQASHIHLATHASSYIIPTLSASQASIYLADGPLLATQIPATLSLGQTRLTVISACESAVRGFEGVDEAFSIGTVMLAAGSACAIGSLWRVDDVATSLLMVGMYEEMMGRGKKPPEALAEAKRWLRELDIDANGEKKDEDGA
ncbi:uncharacterized protein STEHIDRAFT_120102, partial [Stereum hirsutum FP-91666 SS1]|uniref:uncharacterized protein n=1 Tax=Stereum hirsutum (strain FP-91666) TaxID=721885 RepID=UPI000440C1B4